MGKLFSKLIYIVSAIGPIYSGGRDNRYVKPLYHLNEVVVPDVARVATQGACIVEGNCYYLAALHHAVQVLLALPINPLARLAVLHRSFGNVGGNICPHHL